MSYVPELWAQGRERYRLLDAWQEQIDFQLSAPDLCDLALARRAPTGRAKVEQERYERIVSQYPVPYRAARPIIPEPTPIYDQLLTERSAP